MDGVQGAAVARIIEQLWTVRPEAVEVARKAGGDGLGRVRRMESGMGRRGQVGRRKVGIPGATVREAIGTAESPASVIASA